MVLNYKNFFKQVKKINYFEKEATIAVGVSGGVDSITLVILLSKWSKIKNFKIIALIVNHNLRSESSAEAKEVSNYLNTLSIDNKILTLKNIIFQVEYRKKQDLEDLKF